MPLIFRISAPKVRSSQLLGLLTVFLILIGSVGVLRASSPEAWEDFRKDVREKMDKAVKQKFGSYGLIVEPDGTESYGVAIATGTSVQDKKPLTVIGIYNKKTKKLEILEFPGITFGG